MKKARLFVHLLQLLFLTSCVRSHNTAPNILAPPAIRLLYESGADGPGVGDLTWSSGGKSVAAITLVDPQVRANTLLMIGVPTGTQKILVNHDKQFALRWPSFYPDQSKILVRGEGGFNPYGIWSLDLQSDQFSFVTLGYEAALAPDGNQVAVFVGPGYEMKNVDKWAIRLISLGNLVNGRDIFTSSVASGYVRGMTWSPDSSKIAFSFTDVRDPPKSSITTFRILSSSGAIPSNWPNDLPNYILPTWSPDGNYIAAISVADGYDANGKLVIWDLTTGCQEELTGVGDLASPAWSPNGEHIVFTYRGSIYILDLKEARTTGRLQKTCK